MDKVLRRSRMSDGRKNVLGKLDRWVVIALLLSGLLTACGSSQKALEQVKVQLSWTHSAEFAGFYVADQKGYYEQEGIAISLVPGGPEVDSVQEVNAGRAQFGVTAGDGLVRARVEGEDLIAISAIFRHSPLVVMSLAEEGLQKPWDLVGKSVGVVTSDLDSTWDRQFLAMLSQLDIDPASMNFVTIEDYHGADTLKSERMEAANGFFSTHEAVQARLDGDDVNLMFVSDYGVAVYPNVIFIQDVLIRQQPALVEGFVRATLEGYRYAIEHPEEAAELVLKYDDTLDKRLQAEIMIAQVPFIDTGEAMLGEMDYAIWKGTQDMLLEQGLISSVVDLNMLHTNIFVERAR